MVVFNLVSQFQMKGYTKRNFPGCLNMGDKIPFYNRTSTACSRPKEYILFTECHTTWEGYFSAALHIIGFKTDLDH